MNELRLCLGRGGPNEPNHGYTTVLGNSGLGDSGRFQPGPGNSMSYDDLKVIEAKKFLVAAGGGEQRNSTIEEAHADAEVIAATAASARDGIWHSVAPVPGATFGHSRDPADPAVMAEFLASHCLTAVGGFTPWCCTRPATTPGPRSTACSTATTPRTPGCSCCPPLPARTASTPGSTWTRPGWTPPAHQP